MPVATVAVKNLDAARRFYEDKLGLVAPAEPQEPTTVTYRCSGGSLFVYESANAGTNCATAVTWVAGRDVDGIVRALADKGVAFERYDMPGETREGDVYVLGGVRIAWFKDPDGNIQSIVNG
jgi:catechol 2,3-dioxygenase-like lactoylglutathione lyase family enzyme